MNDIIKFDGWDAWDHLEDVYYQVEFLVDFGPWKKGYQARSLSVDYSKRLVEEYDKQGQNVIQSYNYTVS